MGSEKFCLRWNDFETNISSAFRDLREDKDFFDVTIACDDEQIQAHKVILSACSPFFHKILHKNPHPHPLLYLKGVKYIDIQAVLNFMYHGEVNVAQEELNTFLAVAEDLRVKGLTQNQAEPKTNTLYATKSQVQPRASEKAQASPVPLKRPKTTPTISSSPLLDDHDIVEFVPVKSEPKDPLPHVTVQPDDIYSPPSSHPAPRAISTQDDQDMAFQETQGFEDYGQYAEDQGYPGVEDTGGDDNKELFAMLDAQIEGMMFRTDDKVWHCVECDKRSVGKTDITRHIEATHLENHPGFPCHLCGEIVKTRNALRQHKATRHKFYFK